MRPERLNTIQFLNPRKTLLTLNFIALIIYIITQIFITVSAGSISREIDFIRQEKARLRRENEFLKADIQKENSLASAMEMIEKYGLEKKNPTIIQIYQNSNLSMNTSK